MNIIFDLDGTLIDASERMYQLFQKLIPQSTLTKKEYWGRKRSKINHQLLISKEFPNIEFNEFNQEWLTQIENPFFLKMDHCYEDTIYVLEQLKKTNTLYLLTARQSKKNLLIELGDLKLTIFFDKILVTEGKKSKKELLQDEIKINPKKFKHDDWFVSDMGKDIQMGKEMKFYTIAVSHGFMSKEKLLEYQPDKCIDELTELLMVQDLS